MRSLRQGTMAVLISFALHGCTETADNCSDGERLVDGTCTPVEAGDTSDTALEGLPADEVSPVRISLDIQRTPNETHFTLRCGEHGGELREVIAVGEFSSHRVHRFHEDIITGTWCAIELQDVVGAELPSGAVKVCDVQVDAWEAERIPHDDRGGIHLVSEFEVLACIDGCTDPVAENYDPDATRLPHDDFCEYIDGCTDPEASNFDPEATRDDGSCSY